jgi:hypothetical protein
MSSISTNCGVFLLSLVMLVMPWANNGWVDGWIKERNVEEKACPLL